MGRYATSVKCHFSNSDLQCKNRPSKEVPFAGDTHKMEVKCMVYLYDSIEYCNESNCNQTCTNLVQESNDKFNLKFSFVGNVDRNGVSVRTSLDKQFSLKMYPISNLAMVLYQEAIEDHSLLR